MVANPNLPNGEPLTGREMQVLDRISQGLSNHEIADQLVVTPGTVKCCNKHIYRKLGVTNRTKAVVHANRAGLLSQSQGNRSTPRAAFVHNLPAPLTPFIGRKQELDILQLLLAKKRLLTITSHGGAWKTRVTQHMTGDNKRMANLAILVLHYCDLQEAEQLEREAMKIEVELGTKFYVGLYLTCLSGILAKQGNPQ